MHRLTPFLLLLVAALGGCFGGGGGGGGGPPTDPSTGSIRGLVVDQSVVPVAGATIVISGGQNTTSDEAGLFTFTGLAPGDYVVTVTKLGYRAAQTTTGVEGGVAEPALIKVLLDRIATAQPYLDHYKLDGFYECAMALFFVVDTCDFAPRTAWDVANESGSPPPTPRSALAYYNTQEIDVPADTFTIIQEAFWDDERVPLMWIMLDEYPVQADCDCSDSYGGVEAPTPTHMRVERFLPDGSNNTEWQTAGFATASSKGFPAGERVVARGFLPPSDVPVQEGTDPNTWYGLAQNLEFTVITTLFHNYAPPEGWTFATKDDYPVG